MGFVRGNTIPGEQYYTGIILPEGGGGGGAIVYLYTGIGG